MTLRLLFTCLFILLNLNSICYSIEKKTFFVDCEGEVSIQTEKSGSENKEFIQTYAVEISKLGLNNKRITALNIADSDSLMLRPTYKYYWNNSFNPEEISVDFESQNNSLLSITATNLIVGAPVFTSYVEKLNLRTGNMRASIIINSNNDSIGGMIVDYKAKCNGGSKVLSYLESEG